MRLNRVTLWLFALLFTSASANQDSLDFRQTRDRLVSLPARVDSALLATADDLAGAGLYSDARELLLELTAAPDAPARSDSSRPLQWRLCLAGDYNRLEDIRDTAAARQEERDSIEQALARITESPYDLSARASLAWHPRAPSVRKLEPALYVSNRRANAGLSGRFSFLQGGLLLDAAALGEKILYRGPSTNTERGGFVAGSADSSDQLSGSLRLAWSGAARDSRVEFGIPVRLKPVVYRHNRGSYRSHVDYDAVPQIELRSVDLRRTLRLELTAACRDYFDTDDLFGPPRPVDTLDALRLRPAAALELWTDRLTAGAELAYDRLANPNRHSQPSGHEITAAMRIETPSHDILRMRLAASYQFLAEDRRGTWFVEYVPGRFAIAQPGWCPPLCDSVYIPPDTLIVRDDRAWYRLAGHRLRAAPSVELGPGAITLSVALPYVMERFPSLTALGGRTLERRLYMDESTDCVEPEAALRMEGGPLTAGIRAAWLYQHVAEGRYESLRTSRGVGLGADLYWHALPWLALDGRVDYRRTHEKPFTVGSAQRENLDLSLRLCATR